MGNINIYNASLDRTNTVRRMGKQGILYEYELPYGANPMNYYKEAVNVKSIKQSTKYQNGKRPGQYQPVGDKRFFTYYQIRKMDLSKYTQWMIELQEKQEKEMLQAISDALTRVVGHE